VGANVRIYTLAKKLSLSNQDVIDELERLGIRGKTHSSSIDERTANEIEILLRREETPKEAKKPVKAKKAEEAKPEAPAAEKKPAPQKAPEKKTDLLKVEKKPEPPKAEKKPEFPRKFPKSIEPLEKLPPEGEAEIKPAIKDEKLLPEEETVLKVPERFKKEIEAEKVEKFKVKPGMQKAFQSVRKVEPKRWQEVKGGFRRHHRLKPAQKAEKPLLPIITAPRKKTLKMEEGATVKEFAELIGVKLPEIIKKFMELGYMPTINQPVDIDAALLVAEGFGVKVEVAAPEAEEAAVAEAKEDASELMPRAPVVTIMGHVDHGKTSLLDAIRLTKVTETEFGGITQHIGAYKVTLKGKDIVFLDTPGHEAFTAMRARGAKVTDIVVLVVAADDGVKPQTVEAINHAKAANVPIIVAVNKIDKPEANVAKVKNELSEHGIIPEEWGGKNIFAEVSAKKKIGIESLLEMILLQAEVLELKANPDRMARGVIIESKLDKGRGPVATVLVHSGRLNVGDAFLSGINTGKVRALTDDGGRRLDEAGPSTPVEVIGFGAVPTAGDTFIAMDDERKARQIALSRLHKQRAAEIAKKGKLTLDEVYAKIKEGRIKELGIVIKADVQGSVEALKGAFEGITHPEVKVKVIHSSVGGINESDVMLASASDAIVMGFNVRPEPKAAAIAKKEGVDVRLYNVIYDAIDDVKNALEGMLEPTLKENILGRAEVRQTFMVSRLGTIAGCYVLEGSMSRTSDGIRVIRDSIVIYEGKVASLKRFKEDVRDVQSGYECGIMVENFNDIKTGDILENFVIEKVAAKL
jgi:translation initiation factor IF-2